MDDLKIMAIIAAGGVGMMLLFYLFGPPVAGFLLAAAFAKAGSDCKRDGGLGAEWFNLLAIVAFVLTVVLTAMKG